MEKGKIKTEKFSPHPKTDRREDFHCIKNGFSWFCLVLCSFVIDVVSIFFFCFCLIFCM